MQQLYLRIYYYLISSDDNKHNISLVIMLKYDVDDTSQNKCDVHTNKTLQNKNCKIKKY